MPKKYVFRLTEEEVQFIDLALHWMHNDLVEEQEEPFTHPERAITAAQQWVMVQRMQERMMKPDAEEDA